MLAGAFILGLVLLTFLFQGVLDRQSNPNQSPQSTLNASGAREVELLSNRQGHYVADGTINGTPVTFLLDTGATEVSVPGTLADHLRLPTGPPRTTHTANGTITTFGTLLDSVQLGPIALSGVRANINPHMHGRQILLGMSFLKHLDFEQSGRSLTLSLP